MDINELLKGAQHYSPSDRTVFINGYKSLINSGLNNKSVIEVCCGEGALAVSIAKNFPEANVSAIDYNKTIIENLKNKYKNIKNLNFYVSDAANISQFQNESFDIIFVQAAMHHLANNLYFVSSEFSRLLKKGGKCLFIFEPLGHNPVVVVVRALRQIKNQYMGETNLFLHQLESFCSNFSKMEIQYFNLTGYFLKPLPHLWLFNAVSNFANRLDDFIFRKIPKLKKYAANFNVIYTK